MLVSVAVLVAVASVAESAGKFTPKKYDITLTPDFNDKNFTAKALIDVSVTGSVQEFDLKVSKDLEVEKVSFYQAATIYRGNPSLLGSTATTTYSAKDEKLHVTLLGKITPESIKEAGYIEIDYKGKFGEKGSKKGFSAVNAIKFESNLKKGNAHLLFPILEDVPVTVKVSVITPYRAGVETNLKAGKHADVPGGEAISNNFSSGEQKIKLSDVELTLNAPTFAVLDQ